MGKIKISQLPIGKDTRCPWHGPYRDGKLFNSEEILPNNVCPWLYNTSYPYFLGLLYGAKFNWNERGDCQVACPATNGIDVIVQKRDNDGSFDPRISDKMKFVIFAQVVKRNGDCPYHHQLDERIIFPTCMMGHYMCPAAFVNIFPLLRLDPPSCIKKDFIRCPDWADPIVLSIK